MLTELNKERIKREFSLLSEELSLRYPNEHFAVWLVGGVPLMEYTDLKKSGDIDVWAFSDKRLLDLLDNYYMNTRSSGMSLDVSSDMETRFKLSKEFSYDNLKVYIASLEDIVANKLVVNRDKDFEDITFDDVIANVDLDLLDDIIKNELSIDIQGEGRYKQLLRTYDKWLEYVNDYYERIKGKEYGRKKNVI